MRIALGAELNLGFVHGTIKARGEGIDHYA